MEDFPRRSVLVAVGLLLTPGCVGDDEEPTTDDGTGDATGEDDARGDPYRFFRLEWSASPPEDVLEHAEPVERDDERLADLDVLHAAIRWVRDRSESVSHSYPLSAEQYERAVPVFRDVTDSSIGPLVVVDRDGAYVTVRLHEDWLQ